MIEQQQHTPESRITERAKRLAAGETSQLAGAILVATAIAEGFELLGNKLSHALSRWEASQFNKKP